MDDESRLKLAETYLVIQGALVVCGEDRYEICKAILKQRNKKAYEAYDALTTALYMASERLEAILFGTDTNA